ncbi:GTP cyclohydrolase IIa [Fictibacillus terranigra]|uniref:GTP cyclohydrolase IIa n=1 Tax=Fictibacillus terranigra TaxID=3058424 RepID=A0ABT8E930_9BACL|nr:GTP cyclohydrolase IIa [Fictibacillus sp. CENA-BCM004]MDN4074412.1 GTP cyclohydrolase IIa [Fictibacillus sp. CENA-BCM004]
MAALSPAETENGVAIGVIGPSALIERVREALHSFPNFIPLLRSYEEESEVLELTKDLLANVEVLLFLEYHLFRKVKEQMNFHIPVHYVPLMGTGLYRSLFRSKSLYGLRMLTIDSVPNQYVNQILTELNEKNTDVHIFQGSPLATTEEMVNFHLSHFDNRPGSSVLTGVEAVSEKLTALGIPNEWVTPTHQDLIVSLERALLATRTRRNKESQIVVGLVNIDQFRKMVDSYPSEHEVQKLKLDLHRLLLDYVKLLDGHLTNLGGGEYLFFTTRGIFERETRGYKYLPVLDEAEKLLGISLSVGIGFGRTATDAGNHARVALRQCKEFGGKACYIVREDLSVIGPVEITHPMIYDLSITDDKLLEEAEKAGMSAAYMSKLMAQVARYKKANYTAQELAAILGITIRSSHRILGQWIDAGLVDVVGEEKISSKGRPRQIYRLSFVADHLKKIREAVE